MSNNKQVSTIISDSIAKLEHWVESQNYKGYEPFDGQSSYLSKITFKNLFLERILQQVVRRSRINLRPLIGIKQLESTKGRGYMAWGYLTMYQIHKNRQYKEKAFSCLDWLIRNKSPQFEDLSWGNHFQFSSRGGRLEFNEPIIVWTSLIGQTFLESYEIFHEVQHLESAKSIGRWILKLPREKTDRGSCISYVMKRQNSIHNSNMLGAAFLARLSTHWDNKELQEVAKEAIEYSCSRQLKDGSWYYGEAEHFHWIDNFHSGYNLDSLKCYIEKTGDKRFTDALKKGIKYYTTHFFDQIGRPKYYNNSTFPIESQCISQSIETLANHGDIEESTLELSIKVAIWAIENMQDSEGFFYYRKYSMMTDKTPMMHWAQATTYRGLSLLLSKIQ